MDTGSATAKLLTQSMSPAATSSSVAIRLSCDGQIQGISFLTHGILLENATESRVFQDPGLAESVGRHASRAEL